MGSNESQRTRAPSIRDVAALAGVSYQTVSRVLNNSEAIRATTRDRVLAAMEQLRYRPNRAARALVTSRSRTIGVVASMRASYGPARMIQAVESAALDRGYYVSIAHIPGPDAESISAAVERLIDQGVEGLVVMSPQQRVFDALAAIPDLPPYVTLRSRTGGDPQALWSDQIAGARLATAHLADLGHRYIKHLAGPQDWIEADARMQGFLLELSDRDMHVAPPVLGDWTAEFAYKATQELLRWRDFTALFCSNDLMALGAIHAARSMGLDVPGDLSVVGYDDIPDAAHYWPPLTTVRQDFDELGRLSVQMLLDGRDEGMADLVPQLIVRSSTAAPAFQL